MQRRWWPAMAVVFVIAPWWATDASAAGDWAKWGEEPTGFRGLEWGVPLTSIKGMTYAREDPSYGGIDIYQKTGDDLRIGAAQLSAIEYVFWDGKLAGVLLYAQGAGSCRALVDAARAQFGGGGGNEAAWIWEGERSAGYYDYNRFSERCYLHLASKPMEKEMEAAGKAASQQEARKEL